MTGELKAALSLSLGVHAALLVGLPFTNRVAFDVERAPTSIDIQILAPPQPVQAPTVDVVPSEPTPTREPVSEPVPQSVVSEARRGALTDVLPSYLRNPAPVYPQSARMRGDEGTVLLDVEVLPSGRCGALRVLSSSGYPILDEAAAAAIRQWRFRPARRLGQPVSVWVEIPVTFRLID
jgi:protein TonB